MSNYTLDIMKEVGEWEYLEVREVYDGWILKFNRKTKEVEWRDHHRANALKVHQKVTIVESLWKSVEAEDRE